MPHRRTIITILVPVVLALGVVPLRASPPIGAVVQTTWWHLLFPALAAWAQTSSPTQTRLPAKAIKPSKYSAVLPQGEFQDNQIELAADQERRQLRESRYKDTFPLSERF